MTQFEFDQQMAAWNAEQTAANHPLLDEQREINKQRELLRIQMGGVKQQLQALSVRWLEIEQKRKDINRHYHELKHEFVMAHPKSETTKINL